MFASDNTDQVRALQGPVHQARVTPTPERLPVSNVPDQSLPGCDVLFRVARRDTRLASVRYRALLPACALEDGLYRTSVCSSDMPTEVCPRVAIAVKPLQAAEAAWVSGMRARGVPTVVDICDNIFVNGYGGTSSGIADLFRATIRNGLVTVPTESLRAVVQENTGIAPGMVKVVPDIVESAGLLRRQWRMVDGRRAPILQAQLVDRVVPWVRRSARVLGVGRPVLLWFGNHGGSYARFGLDDLMLWEDALRDASALGAQLWVVSNNRQRFEAMRTSLPIRARYFEWSPSRVDALLGFTDVCLVPNSMDAFSRSKSPNRALKALAAGVPVVATPTPAMKELDGAVWLDTPSVGIRAYLEGTGMRERHLASARLLMAQKFSMAALRDAMTDVVQEALAYG